MKIRNIILIIIALVVVAFIGFRFTQNNSVDVKKISIKQGDVIKSVSTSGFVKSDLETEFGFPVSGKITHIYFKEGDTVKEGDLIAQVYNEDLFFTAESARKDKDAIQRNRDIYEEQYSNDKKSAGGENEYDLNIRRLTDQLRSADNKYKASLSNLQETYLYSPMDGTLTSFDYKVGMVVGSTDTIKVADLSKLEFQADLDQEDYQDLQAGQEVEIELDSYPNEKFKGEVLNKPLYVNEDSVTKTFEVRIKIDNPQDKIVKGMTGDANIITSKSSSSRYLPFDAVYYDESGKPYVWTVNDKNEVTKTSIILGLEGDTLTEIKSQGLEEVVVPVEASKPLKEGQKANIL